MFQWVTSITGFGALRSRLTRLAVETETRMVEATHAAADDFRDRLVAATPVRSGNLQGSYVVSYTSTGAGVGNSANYFRFVLMGTGVRGQASNVPESLFGDTGGYGPQPGMAANRELLQVWIDAPSDVERFMTPYLESMVA